MTDEDDDREQGIEFGGLDDDLEEVDYPITNEELVERFGTRTLGTADGEVTVRETLAGQSDVTYESPGDVHDAVLNMVGSEAVGRKGYSDREPSIDDGREDDEESF